MALTVLKVPMVSISMTDLKPLGESPDMGATKLPAAPALDSEDSQYAEVYYLGMMYRMGTDITKSIAPSSLTQRSAAALRLSNCGSRSVCVSGHVAVATRTT